MNITKINDLLTLIDVIAAFNVTYSDDETIQSLNNLSNGARRELEDKGIINRVKEAR